MGLRFKTPLHTLFELRNNSPISIKKDGHTWYTIFSELDFANDFMERSKIMGRVLTLHTVNEIVFIFDGLRKGDQPVTDFSFLIDPLEIPGEGLRSMGRDDFLQAFRDHLKTPPAT